MKNKMSVYPLLALAVLILVALACGSTSTEFAHRTPPQPEATATPRPIAPPCKEIAEKVEPMTEAQRKAYLSTLVGNSVTSWIGRVSEVDVKYDGSYELQLDMNSPAWYSFRVYRVYFDIPDDIALEFEIDQAVVFSGTIDRVKEFSGSVIVYLNDVSLEN